MKGKTKVVIAVCLSILASVFFLAVVLLKQAHERNFFKMSGLPESFLLLGPDFQVPDVIESKVGFSYLEHPARYAVLHVKDVARFTDNLKEAGYVEPNAEDGSSLNRFLNLEKAGNNYGKILKRGSDIDPLQYYVAEVRDEHNEKVLFYLVEVFVKF